MRIVKLKGHIVIVAAAVLLHGGMLCAQEPLPARQDIKPIKPMGGKRPVKAELRPEGNVPAKDEHPSQSPTAEPPQFRPVRDLPHRQPSAPVDTVADDAPGGSAAGKPIRPRRQPPEPRSLDTVVIVDLPDAQRLEMVLVEGGTFTMGNNGSDDVSHSYESSRPAHQVTLKSYYISTFEVTQGVWKTVMGDNPSKFGGNDSLPVEQVTWDDAQRFVTLLSQFSGRRFRLPTEAEWEYAARGGKRSQGYAYAGCVRGQLESYAWFCVNSKGRTYPVGRCLPNELGLYDMSGNVAEWCADWMEPYGDGEITDPRGPQQGDSRIIRGGHYYSTSSACAVFDRSWYVPTGKSEFYGFRVVMDPDEEWDDDDN